MRLWDFPAWKRFEAVHPRHGEDMFVLSDDGTYDHCFTNFTEVNSDLEVRRVGEGGLSLRYQHTFPSFHSARYPSSAQMLFFLFPGLPVHFTKLNSRLTTDHRDEFVLLWVYHKANSSLQLNILNLRHGGQTKRVPRMSDCIHQVTSIPQN